MEVPTRSQEEKLRFFQRHPILFISYYPVSNAWALVSSLSTEIWQIINPSWYDVSLPLLCFLYCNCRMVAGHRGCSPNVWILHLYVLNSYFILAFVINTAYYLFWIIPIGRLCPLALFIVENLLDSFVIYKSGIAGVCFITTLVFTSISQLNSL